MCGKKISVIVTAHDRKEFLKEALLSIRDQTLDRKLFQVVVVKNFLDPNLDDLIESFGYDLLNGEASLAKKILEALKICEGEIITFLEDDDKYHPDRLARILDVFENHPECIFYHNSLQEIDLSGTSLKRSHHPMPKKTHLFSSEDMREILSSMISGNTDYNTGCMAVKKSLLESNIDVFKGATDLTFTTTDSLYFLFALNSGKSVFIDETTLTFVRRHDSMSVSLKSDPKENAAFIAKFSETYASMLTYISDTFKMNPIAREYIRLKFHRARIETIICNAGQKNEVLAELFELIRLNMIPKGKYDLLLYVSSVLFLFSKPMSFFIFSRILKF